ncbi:kinesin light chain [Ophiostoma piceae UAMH 11346]|uniref:Kinesin light chain n=1 Tax=Ophiostoma piceae (strain UAMH 11346) TaxID=1262450 RepID=S3CPT9_OPHP1|nr:kinesin light chain [Ophiostoma piceae UAMH 11346]
MTSKPLCLLALDGGGIRGLSELLILEEIMSRIKRDRNLDYDPLPADFFDLIGGTSTGGLIALLLGRLRLSVPEAREEYVKISQHVFSTDWYRMNSKSDGNKLEAAVKKLLQEKLGDDRVDERMLDPAKPPCKAFVCAVTKVDVQARAGPRLFRTYNVRTNATFNCTIWEASRATSAAPTYFDPISIGNPGEQETFVDGGLGYNNPIKKVLEEASLVFPNRQVGCVVSIGTGLASAIQFPRVPFTRPFKLVKALAKMATESDVTAEEIQVQFQETKDTYFRFSVDRGLNNIHLAESNNFSKVRTYTTEYIRQSTVSFQIDAVVKALLASKPEPGSDGSTSLIPISAPFSKEGSSQNPPRMLPWSTEDAIPNSHHKIEDLVPTTSNIVWSVPFQKNKFFTSRESDLERLRTMLFEGSQTSIAAITGLGGIGKTQLALALAYETKANRTDYTVLWIPAANTESIELAYLDAAQKLGILGANDAKADVTKLVRDHLSEKSAGRWLLVFDNADDIEMWTNKSGGMTRYLPNSPYGSIVFTTRVRDVALALTLRNIVHISELDEAGSKQLFRNYLLDEEHSLNNENDTVVLLAELAYLPLAIVQAAAYINRNMCSLQHYLTLLGNQEDHVINLLSANFGGESHYTMAKDPVATTWLISFEQIRERDPLAAQYLSHMACVDAKNIPPSLLSSSPSPVDKDNAMGTLQGYSLIAKRTSTDPVNMHRLVHLATRNWLQKENSLLKYTHAVMLKLRELLSNVDQGNRVVWKTYMPHVDYTLKTRIKNDNHKAIPALIHLYGLCLLYDGRYNEAEIQLVEALKICKKILGVDHPDTLTSMSNLASTYWNQGRWEEAEKLEAQVMETSKKILGVDHPDTLTSIQNLASTYSDQGRWEEAEKLQAQVMETSKKILGVDHPDTLRSIHNLALTYSNQGRWEEAEKLQAQVMETRKKIFGVDYPGTLASINNLASTYWKQGRWEEAEKLQAQVMETRKKILGVNHPDTLTSIQNLASTYSDQGRWEEAEKLQAQVMETSKKILGVDHPDTLRSIHNLALTYSNQGRWEEAEKLQAQVIETRKKILGVNHPDTLTSIQNLASTYSDQGRWEEAEKLQTQVIETSKKILGVDHPDTLTSMNNLAHIWRNQGRDVDAVAMMKDCVLARQRVLGLEHPRTKESMAALAAWS